MQVVFLMSIRRKDKIMNKRDYKRYKQIKLELQQLEQDENDTLNEISDLIKQRNTKGLKYLYSRLEHIIALKCLRETIREELLLPKWIKMENGMQPLLDWWHENYEMVEDYAEVEEHIAMYLTDNYNHNVYGFDYFVKGKDIYVTNIIWNENQILVSDLKHKAKTDIVKNDFVEIIKSNTDKCWYLTDKRNGYTTSRTTLRETIEWLEKHYYM